jgi:hypothetical protein
MTRYRITRGVRYVAHGAAAQGKYGKKGEKSEEQSEDVRRLVDAAVVDASVGELDCGGLDFCVLNAVGFAELAEQNPGGQRHIISTRSTPAGTGTSGTI